MSHWIHLADGTEHYLSHAEAALNTYRVETLAHHLAIINRFTGATRRPYSVAEHSLLCADIAEACGATPPAQLACLMHDAHEAIVGDASTPTKWSLGESWAAFEDRHARALRRHFGLQATFAAYGLQARQIDLVALATERRDLLQYDPERHRPWPILDRPGCEVQPHATSLTTAKREQMHWSEWRDLFIQRYQHLSAQIEAAGLLLAVHGQEPQP
ncbi:hypothetical protein [Paracidovorax wautersii]|uniref:hypothetical protein n=1 Tax=Paracidovorax wautersii TaxID=1177982 RepID=UPI0031DD2684